jgi:hypothetical protein
VATALFFSLFAWMTAEAHSSQPAAASASVSTVQRVEVHRGDTLWGIANKNLPDGENVRSYMNKLMKKNNLTGSALYEGQLLYLP